MWVVDNWRHMRPNVRVIIIVALLSMLFLVWQAMRATVASSPVRASANTSSEQTTISTDNSASTDTINPAPASNEEGQSMGKSSATVNINGQDIPVPDNGSVQKTLVSPDGKTTVSIDVQNSSTGETTNNSSASTHVQVNTFSSSSTTSVNRTTERK